MQKAIPGVERDVMMLPERLEISAVPSKPLLDELAHFLRGFRVRDGRVTRLHNFTGLESFEGNIKILHQGIRVILTAAGQDFTPVGTQGAGHHGDTSEDVKSATKNIDAGDIFKRLALGQPVVPVEHFYVARHGAYLGVAEGLYQVYQRVFTDLAIGIDDDDYLTAGKEHTMVQGRGFAAVRPTYYLHAPVAEAPGYLQSAVGRAVINDDDLFAGIRSFDDGFYSTGEDFLLVK